MAARGASPAKKQVIYRRDLEAIEYCYEQSNSIVGILGNEE